MCFLSAQDCIPVGCLLIISHVCLGGLPRNGMGVCPGEEVSAQGAIYLGEGGVSLGGGVCPGGLSAGVGVGGGGRHPPREQNHRHV